MVTLITMTVDEFSIYIRVITPIKGTLILNV